ETPRHFRVDTGGASPSGYDDALFDLHVGDETAVLGGSALGGGRQINANVALEPEAWIFTQTEWPNGIRNTADPLKEWFKKAETILASQKFSGPVEPDKTTQFKRWAPESATVGNPASITVNLSHVRTGQLNPCVGC